MLDEMTKQNASKLATFLEYEKKTHVVYCHFSFLATLFFPLMNAMVCPHRPGHSKGGKTNEKRRKTTWNSYSKNIANFEAFDWVNGSFYKA